MTDEQKEHEKRPEKCNECETCKKIKEIEEERDNEWTKKVYYKDTMEHQYKIIDGLLKKYNTQKEYLLKLETRLEKLEAVKDHSRGRL